MVIEMKFSVKLIRLKPICKMLQIKQTNDGYNFWMEVYSKEHEKNAFAGRELTFQFKGFGIPILIVNKLILKVFYDQ